jgi:hypothetical protein
MESYGGKMYNDADVQEAKAIDAAIRQYDAQQGSSGAAKPSSKSSSNRKWWMLAVMKTARSML